MNNEEIENGAKLLLCEVISPSRAELIDCIQNLMGVFDTPIARRKIVGEYADEVRKDGREIIDKLRRNNYA